MTTNELKSLLSRVLTWPQHRQVEAARILSEMEEQDASPLGLTDQQAAEIERRLADPDLKVLTVDEVRERLMRQRK